jgi:hypothetical protein
MQFQSQITKCSAAIRIRIVCILLRVLSENATLILSTSSSKEVMESKPVRLRITLI